MSTSLTGAVDTLYYVGESRIHGKGLFAARHIQKDTLIGVFEGPITDQDGIHVLWVHEDTGRTYGVLTQNDMKYANHSSRPNAELNGEEMYATRAIKPHEEITFDYGDDWTDVP